MSSVQSMTVDTLDDIYHCAELPYRSNITHLKVLNGRLSHKGFQLLMREIKTLRYFEYGSVQTFVTNTSKTPFGYTLLHNDTLESLDLNIPDNLTPVFYHCDFAWFLLTSVEELILKISGNDDLDMRHILERLILDKAQRLPNLLSPTIQTAILFEENWISGYK
ncbi:hypothetical protein MMC14_007040, partial [Varicellaria rhodocarpa]|nr:hypothetical protein [Varicellaria rhodocarpa]